MEESLIEMLANRPPREWASELGYTDEEYLARSIRVVESLLPEWAERYPEDQIPGRAVNAARALMKERTPGLEKQARLLAKECSKARRRSLGYTHRIAESVREIVNAAAATNPQRRIDFVSKSLSFAEEHVVYMHAVRGDYGKESEVRREFLMIIGKPTGPVA